jgi:nucleoside 2-deoxyribosyltransferase
MIKIYLACPYSHKDKAIREARVSAADECAAWLLGQGFNVFSPLSHSYNIARFMDNHNDSDFWVNLCMDFVDWCDVFAILKVPGHMQSKGIATEFARAEATGKKIIFIGYNNKNKLVFKNPGISSLLSK